MAIGNVKGDGVPDFAVSQPNGATLFVSTVSGAGVIGWTPVPVPGPVVVTNFGWRVALAHANVKVSSASLAVVARDLRFVGGNTSAPVEDSGNANPDNAFRYDSAGYTYNLSTKGLMRGRYLRTSYVGSDHSFFYSLGFEIK